MSEPFLAEIKIVGFNFAPRGWAFCDGQILPINQNQSLYSLLGTTYGGDGRTTFALPEMRGRTPVHVGSANGPTYTLGQKTGEENHTLSTAELPSHDHASAISSDPGDTPIPVDNTLAFINNGLNDGNNPVVMNQAVGLNGGGQAHNNMQPYLAMNFCIAIQGLFPPRN